MSPLPPRVRCPPSSAIRAAGPGGGDGVVSLALGDPALPLPASVQEALAELEYCGYGPQEGQAALRDAIARYEGVAPDEVLVTCGAQGALYVAAQTYLGPGDQALVPDPGFPAYRQVTELAGARAVPYPLGPAPRFDLDPRAVLATLEATPRTRIVFINHPANPTGGTATADSLRSLAEACAEAGVLLIADEVYRELYLGERPPALRSLTPTGLAVGSISKAWGAPGLRVGWLTGAAPVVEACRAVHAAMVTSAAAPSQTAARLLLEDRARLATARRALGRRWDTLATIWCEATGDLPQPPRGGIYHWFPLPVDDDVAFCRELRGQAGVAVVPGSAFGLRGRGAARLCFATQARTLFRGLGRLLSYLERP